VTVPAEGGKRPEAEKKGKKYGRGLAVEGCIRTGASRDHTGPEIVVEKVKCA
jgi:hypothetical protein